MRLFLFVIVLTTLACGIPIRNEAFYTRTINVQKVSTDVKMVVTAHALNFRTCGSMDCPADPKGLKQGQEVRVYLHCTGGEFADWVAIDYDCTRWVRSSWLEAK